MQMTEELDKLKDLQEVLAEKYDIEAKVEELPKSIQSDVDALERFKKDFIEKSFRYDEQKTKVAEIKAELEQTQKFREESEKGMDDISSHREYELLDKQISEAQNKENSLRKDLQREEKYLADLNDQLDGDKGIIDQTEKNVTEANDSLSKELKKHQDRLDSLSKKEAKISDGIDPEIIIKFQRIIKRNRVGIVAVKGNVCDGCHMILPAQFANEVHKGEKILFCPYCSRILYYEEAEDVDANYYSLEESGSLADLDEDFIEDEDEEIVNEEFESEEDDAAAMEKSSDYE